MRDTLYFIGLCAVGVVLFSVFVAPMGSGTTESEGFDSVDEFNESGIRALTFVEQNEARESASVQTVERDDDVDAVAQAWAEEMAETGFYSHGDFEQRVQNNTNCELSGEVISKSGVLERYTNSSGENVHLDSNSAIANFLIDSWMESSQHRLIMTDEAFTHVGVGVSITEDGTLYAVMDYCRY
jgi:uncharacterized protein YkwD